MTTARVCEQVRPGPPLETLLSAEQVALSPQCAERGEVWLPADEERWQAHWIDDGPEEKLVFYCPACAEREWCSP